MKILRNPTENDVLDYRIEELEFDSEGKPVYDRNTGEQKKTGNTFEWSIKAGETLEFPDYVADYLLKVYGFLEEVKKTEKLEVKEAPKDTSGKFACKYCGQTFKTTMNLGVHLGSKHPEKLV